MCNILCDMYLLSEEIISNIHPEMSLITQVLLLRASGQYARFYTTWFSSSGWRAQGGGGQVFWLSSLFLLPLQLLLSAAGYWIPLNWKIKF